MKTSDLRHTFIEFFKSKQHTYVPSASTIPVDDKTILFTIAGMAQFKGCFIGQEKRAYVRATNSQKCVRVADLNDVGKDGRHLTMFEMLGSWSFGDYYKKEAIAWAYEFVRDVLKLDLSRLWISVHYTDQETAEIWNSIGIPTERVVKLGDKDNFWAMGPTGPCGPCTEMYFDQGVEIGSCYEAKIDCKGPGCDCDRFLEFWNLVFMQFKRDESGTLHDLPMKSVDTGMGLERLASLLQNKTSVFDIDLFIKIRKHILHTAQNTKSISELTSEERECTNVIADHMRLLCFTIADGANFSNEGRGYVLRRVLRRAVRYVHKLCPTWNKTHSFLAKIVAGVVEECGDFFTELKQQQNRIQELIFHEEIKFNQTLEGGLQKFYEFLNQAKLKNQHVLSGEHVFILHDTFGFPADLTRILCEENLFAIDMPGYETYMMEQKTKSRADSKFYTLDDETSPWTIFHPEEPKEESFFNGYFLQPNFAQDHTNYFQKNLLFTDIKRIRQLKNGTFELVINNTPFYPEGGGQISDTGFIEIKNGDDKFKFNVIDVKKTPRYISHILTYEDYAQERSKQFSSEDFTNLIHAGSSIFCAVNLNFRLDMARHHTATHLLHKSLQIVLGENVRQAGSLVKNDLLRFDFSHHKSLAKSELLAVENLVNAEILKNSVVYTHQDVPVLEAKNMGAMAMFDEKYDDKVRVLQIDNFSLELCGGLHVNHTGNIGQFKILSESSVTSGVRRIEAVAGLYSLDHVRTLEDTIETASVALKCAKIELISKISQTKELAKNQDKVIADLQNKIVSYRLQKLLTEIDDASQLKIVVSYIPDCSLKELELICDKIKARPFHIAVLGTVIENKAHLIAGMHSNVLTKNKDIHLGKLMRTLCENLNGNGGGKPDFAKGSGTAIDKLNDVLDMAKSLLNQ